MTTEFNQRKMSKKHTQVIECYGRIVEYFLNEGWTIIAYSPTSDQSKQVLFYVSKVLEEKLTKKDRDIMFQEAKLYADL